MLKLQYKKFSVLFCGDANGSTLERLTDTYGDFLESDVIKIPHHGGNVGDENITKHFFGAVGAKTAIISVAKINKYRAPSQKTITVITALNPMLYETKDNGAITISVYGTAPYAVKPYVDIS